jgi:uncharacterized protein (DUF1800 family)
MDNWKKINHLHLRAGFGLSPEEAIRKQDSNLTVEIRQLFNTKGNSFRLTEPAAFTKLNSQLDRMADGAAKRKTLVKGRKFAHDVNYQWLEEMVKGKYPLEERMTLFWHGHFACLTRMPHLITKQVNALRKNALGSFRDLVHDIAKDPAMIFYLNNQQNNKKMPNENFARELMELFTIGIGNYTEEDIKEAGRAFTGWKAEKRTAQFKFTERQHDKGSKTFMGRTGHFNGEDIINIILENRNTAKYIATKVYKYFVNPKVIDSQVEELTDIFFKSDYNISKMMRHLFSSNWFYDQRNIGIKIKSPIELLVGMIKVLDINFRDKKRFYQIQRELGQVLFQPPNVAGWPGDKAWIDNSTLMTRLTLPSVLKSKNLEVILEKKKRQSPSTAEVSVNLCPYVDNFAGASDKELADFLFPYLLQVKPSVKKEIIYDQFVYTTEVDRIKKMLHRIMSLPEYQLC